jgi:uroporphyrinogen-III synthase
MLERYFKGLRILALETRHTAQITGIVQRYGGEALVIPAVRKIQFESQEHAVQFATGLMRGDFDLVIFLTELGVQTMIDAVAAKYDSQLFLSALRKVKIAARGPKPAAALRELHVPVTVTAPQPCTWRELMQAMEQEFGSSLRDMHVAVQEYAASNAEFLLALAEHSSGVTRVPLYQWSLPEDVQPLRECVLGVAAKQIDIVLFTTAIQVIHLFDVAAQMGCSESLRAGLQTSVVLSIGPNTSEELNRHGIASDFEPSRPRIESLLNEAAQLAHELIERKRAGNPISLSQQQHAVAVPNRATRVVLPRPVDAKPVRILKSAEPVTSGSMDFLHEIGSRMAAADPFHAVLQRIIDFVSSVIPCDSCFIYVLEQDELVLRASKNPHANLVDHLGMKLGQGITGWVAQHREPVSISAGALQDARFKMFKDLPEDRFEAFLSIPILCAGKVVGVINLQHRKPYQHSHEEVRLLSMIGFLVGAEIERVRLETENLQLSDKLELRKIIDRAKGVLQRDLGIDEDVAYHMLQKESRQRRKSMREIAEAILLSDEVKKSQLPVRKASAE